MINVVICDDDEGCCSLIEGWIMAYRKREKIDIDISIYNSASKLSELLDKGESVIDFIFLDIEMPGLNGVELGNQIRQAYDVYDIVISYISAHTNYCLDLFRVEPINFHQKPLKEKDIIEDIEKYIRRNKRRKRVIRYFEEGRPREIMLRDVMFIRAIGKEVEIVLANGEHKPIHKSFLDCCNELDEKGLIKCHRSYLINLSYVNKYRARVFELIDETEIPVGKSFVEKMKSAWAHFGS